MPEAEEKLLGGNVADSVVRVGDTVRKPATGATPAIEALLAHLRLVECAPRSLGRDDAGRHVLEFVPGPVWCRRDQGTEPDLRRVGGLIRELHDALSDFRPSVSEVWHALSVADGEDLICHNDLAPWNLICGEQRWVFVDWDNAAPGTRLWDLAWAALSFPPVEPDCDLPVAATKILALTQGYGLQPSAHLDLLRLMVRRARAAADLLSEGARAGRQPWARLYAEGHGRYWGPVSSYIESNLSILAELLARDSAQSDSNS